MSKAQELMTKANKKLGSFFSFFNDVKYEEASDLYRQAGALYKAESNWNEAGLAFARAGDCLLQQRDDYGFCTNYGEAGICFKRAKNASQASNCWKKAVEAHIYANRFSAAARLEEALGHLYLSSENYEQTIICYQRAIRFFQSETSSRSSASKLTEKLAIIYTTQHEYTKAFKLFEELGLDAVNTPLKLAARQHFFHALLCFLSALNRENIHEGVAELREKVEHYSAKDGSLHGSREIELILDICNALEERDHSSFQNAVQKYNTIEVLDDVKLSLLYNALQLVEITDER